MSTKTVPYTAYKVKDIELAEYGRREIELAEAEEAKDKARKEQDVLKKAESKRKSSSSRRSSTRMNPIVKVLTSATFIRSVFGILTKMMKK